MMNNILLGIKDIKQNILVMICFILISIISTFIFISTTLSMLDAGGMNNKKNIASLEHLSNAHIIAPISTDMSNNEKFLQKINDFVQTHKTYTIFNTYKFETEHLFNILIGDGSLYIKNLPNTTKTTLYYIGDAPLKQSALKLNDSIYPIMHIPSEKIIYDIDLSYSEPIEDGFLLYLKENDIKDFVNYRDGSDIVTMIENLDARYITSDDIQNLVKNSFLQVVENFADDQETNFILTYMYPFLICLLIALASSFYIFLNSYMAKIQKDLTLHHVYGATTRDMIERITTMISPIFILDTLFIFYMMMSPYQIDALIGFIFLFIIIAIFETVLILQVKKKHFLSNLRGG